MLPADKFWFVSYVLLSESDIRVVSGTLLHLNSELNLRIRHGGYGRQNVYDSVTGEHYRDICSSYWERS